MDENVKNRRDALVNAHWDGYNGPLIDNLLALLGFEDDQDEAVVHKGAMIRFIRFVYVESGKHFYGHGKEDQAAGH